MASNDRPKDLSARNLILATLLSVSVGISGAGLVTWRQTSILEQRVAAAEETIRTNNEEIKKVYQIDGSLKVLIDEVRNLRLDIREGRAQQQQRER